jgi:hypothetical protein
MCEAAERRALHDLKFTALAMESEAALGGVYDSATREQQGCPTSETLAYVRLRAAELGKGAPIDDTQDGPRGEWRALAHETSPRFPHSVRIMTIEARARGSVDAARKATAVDPSYAPAQVALAAALLAANDAPGAVHVLEQTKGLEKTSDGLAILARARFASGDVPGAAKAAKAALHERAMELIEADANDPRPVALAHEVLGLALLIKRRYEEAARHLIAAKGSERARVAIEQASPALARALAKVRSGKN